MKRTPDPIAMWLLTLRNEKLFVHAIVLDEPKQSPMRKIAELIKFEDPDAYIFFGEGWAKAVKKDQLNKFMENHKYGDVKTYPDKFEVLFIQGKSKDGKNQINKMYSIKRDEAKRIIDFDEHSNPDKVRSVLP